MIDPILKQISTAVEHQTNLKAELDNAGIKITGAVQNADSLKTEIDGLIKESLTSTSEVKDSYEATVKNQLENLAGSLGSTGSSVSALLTQLNEGASDLTDITNSASDDLALIHTSLSDSSTLLSNVSEQLSSASEALLNPNRDGLSVLTDLLAQNRKQSPPFLRLRSVFPSIRSTRSKITDRQWLLLFYTRHVGWRRCACRHAESQCFRKSFDRSF